MPSIISAGTTANTGLNLTADTSGNLVFQTNGNTTAMTIDTSQNVTFANNVTYTGTITATAFTSGLGNASAPAFRFTGDTNTGIFSPAADTIAFTEGGTESMRITSAGDVGIGTSSPASKLDVSSSSVNGANIALNKTNSGTANQNGQLINFYNYGPAATGRNAGTLIGGFYFGCSQPSSGAIQDAGAISCVAESQSGNNTASALAFSTNTGNSGNAERMRITSDGLLQFNSGYGSVATAYGCRAWVYFDPSGSILASGNVSSVSKNSTGNYTVSFTNAMPSGNYSAVATCDIGGWNAGNTQTGGYNAGSISIQTRNTSMTATDASVSLAIFR